MLAAASILTTSRKSHTAPPRTCESSKIGDEYYRLRWLGMTTIHQLLTSTSHVCVPSTTDLST